MEQDYVKLIFRASEDGEKVTLGCLNDALQEQDIIGKVDFVERSYAMPNVPYQVFGIFISNESLPLNRTREDAYQIAHNIHSALLKKGVDVGAGVIDQRRNGQFHNDYFMPTNEIPSGFKISKDFHVTESSLRPRRPYPPSQSHGLNMH